MSTPAHNVRGPFFDELQVRDTFPDAPVVTLTEGLLATHSAIVGNRLRLALDAELAKSVTGRSPLASPALLWDVSIGQSTLVTQHVKANVFYRGMRLLRIPQLGDSLRTTTIVVGLRQNSPRENRAATGLAALRVETDDQQGRPVLHYWRCAMLPLSPGAITTGPRDNLDAIGADADDHDLPGPTDEWNLARYRDAVGGQSFTDMSVGKTWVVEGADVVSSAPELARLTGNIARVHHDAEAAGGRRLVYGGHTIGLAFHQVCRALPSVVTVASWDSCDHLGPVHEGDALTSKVSIESLRPLPDGGGLMGLRVLVDASELGSARRRVLDWRLNVVMA
jgi:acyl dehydratase